MGAVCRNLDCRNYAPVDVIKGVCHSSKLTVLADGETCSRFEKLPKCKFCGQYEAGPEEFAGICRASASRPMTYPDLCGVTCEFFEWKKA